MALPIMTSADDLEAVIGFLKTKVAGAAIGEAEAVLGGKLLDGRKLSGYQAWGFIARDGDRISLTPTGRQLARAGADLKQSLYRDALRSIPPYWLIVEWVHHQRLDQVTNIDVASHWFSYCPEALGSDNERTIADQAVCFFNLAQAAGIGVRYIGRRGSSTRLEVSLPAIADLVDASEPLDNALEPDRASMQPTWKDTSETSESDLPELPRSSDEATPWPPAEHTPAHTPTEAQRVFIAHGKNGAIVNQLKELLTFGKFVPVVAIENETPSKLVSDKVLEDMESCFAGVIHIAGEAILRDDNGNTHHKINENVLIEIGAALAFFRKNVVLLVEKGILLPSNLQGLYRCEYEGDSLDYQATMKLLKTFNELK